MVPTDMLADVELFARLETDDLRQIAEVTERKSLRRGQRLFSPAEDPRNLFVVVEGRIAIANRSYEGRESVVALMEPGDLFGEMPLFDGRPRSASARALEPTEVMIIPYEPLRTLYQQRPGLLWNVVELLISRLRATDEALADSIFLDVSARTAKRLLEMSDGREEFALPITQEELAGLIGSTRERVNRAISSFVRLGWIDQSDRHYRILKRDELERRAR